VLETGLLATYARVYLQQQSGGVAGLKGNWDPQDDDDVGLHTELLRRRSQVHAHTDRSGHRTLTDLSTVHDEVEPFTFAEEGTELSGSDLERIAELARRQRARFDAALTDAYADLRENTTPARSRLGGDDRA
jgi:hypothetical protein